MAQKTFSPNLLNLLGGTIHDLSTELTTMEPQLDKQEQERYLEYHALDFLREEIARNSAVQSEILIVAQEKDFHTPSAYENMDTIPNLNTLQHGDITVEGVLWNRLIGHFFVRFLELVKQGVLGI